MLINKLLWVVGLRLVGLRRQYDFFHPPRARMVFRASCLKNAFPTIGNLSIVSTTPMVVWCGLQGTLPLSPIHVVWYLCKHNKGEERKKSNGGYIGGCVAWADR